MKKTNSKQKGVPPSRIRYEKENPTVSARVPKEVRDALYSVLTKSGLSLAEVLKSIAAGSEIMEVAIEKTRKTEFEKAKNRYMITCACSKCGKPMVITNPKTKEILGKYLTEHQWHHEKCPEGSPKS